MCKRKATALFSYGFVQGQIAGFPSQIFRPPGPRWFISQNMGLSAFFLLMRCLNEGLNKVRGQSHNEEVWIVIFFLRWSCKCALLLWGIKLFFTSGGFIGERGKDIGQHTLYLSPHTHRHTLPSERSLSPCAALRLFPLIISSPAHHSLLKSGQSHKNNVILCFCGRRSLLIMPALCKTNVSITLNCFNVWSQECVCLSSPAAGRLRGDWNGNRVKMALLWLLEGSTVASAGGGRGCDHRLGSLNALSWSALPSGCITCLGFSRPLVAAPFPRCVKPDGTVSVWREAAGSLVGSTEHAVFFGFQYDALKACGSLQEESRIVMNGWFKVATFADSVIWICNLQYFFSSSVHLLIDFLLTIWLIYNQIKQTKAANSQACVWWINLTTIISDQNWCWLVFSQCFALLL